MLFHRFYFLTDDGVMAIHFGLQPGDCKDDTLILSVSPEGAYRTATMKFSDYFDDALSGRTYFVQEVPEHGAVGDLKPFTPPPPVLKEPRVTHIAVDTINGRADRLFNPVIDSEKIRAEYQHASGRWLTGVWYRSRTELVTLGERSAA